MQDKTVVNVSAPPPPSEVKIRTMRSDLESMRASGGGAPKFQNVAISGLTLDKEYKSVVKKPSPAPVSSGSYVPPSQLPATPAATPVVSPSPAPMRQGPVSSGDGSGSHLLPIIIVVGVAILALIAVGYVAYITFSK